MTDIQPGRRERALQEMTREGQRLGMYPCKCGGEMRPGIAMQSTVVGSADFPGGEAVTLTEGGPGRLVDCWKCSDCGWSYTKGE